MSWLADNLEIIQQAQSVFAASEGGPQKVVRLLRVSPEEIEIDNFFETDISIFFVYNKIRHILDLSILRITEKGTTLFEPGEHREETVTRSEKRINLIEKKQELYIANFISDYEIAAQVEYHHTKIERAKYLFAEALKKYFYFVEIYFFHEIMTSSRGKAMREFKKPIFIYNINNKVPENDLDGTTPSEVYFKRIKPFDRRIPQDAQMDITVPIVYANQVPYGFIYTNSEKQWPTKMLDQVKGISGKLNDQLIKAKVIVPIETQMRVLDISYSGLSVVFQNRRLLSVLKENANFVGDLLLPGGEKAPIAALVRNVGSAGRGFLRAGLQFDIQNQAQMDTLEGYISSLAN